MTQGIDPILLQGDDILQLVIQKAAQGSKIEKMIAKFFGNDLPAVITKCAFDLRIHVLSAILERIFLRKLLLDGVERDTPAICDCLDDGPVGP